MTRIDILFGDIDHRSHPDYIRMKIATMFRAKDLMVGRRGKSRLTAAILDTYTNAIAHSRLTGNVARPPLSRRYKTSHFSAAERRKLETQIRCLVRSVNQQYPLLDGEHLLSDSDTPSYLTTDWLDYPRYTVLMERRTNLATTYYVLPNVVAEPRKHRVSFASLEPTGRASATATGAPPDFADIARKIAKALAGKAPAPYNMIGALLIDIFWPTGSDANKAWDKVYAELQTIVKNGLAEAEVRRASAKVKGFVSFLSTEYVALKQSPRKRPGALLAALHPYDTAFFLDIVNVFMFEDKPTADIATASLANFLLGANLHIALNQERALVDPDYVDDPSASPYATTAANLAKLYADYAEAAVEGVVSARLKQVTGVLVDHKTHCTGGAASRCTTTWYYWFEDRNPKPIYKSKVYHYNDQQKDPPPAEKNATNARKTYIKDLESKLRVGVPEVVKHWREIQKNPIAMSYAAPASAPLPDADGWAGSTPVKRSKKWKAGYKVRYAVSYYFNRQETAKGPWWSPDGADKEGYFDGTPQAMPTLIELPIDPFYHAEGRRVYRQFEGYREELIATIRDNMTTRFNDTKK